MSSDVRIRKWILSVVFIPNLIHLLHSTRVTSRDVNSLCSKCLYIVSREPDFESRVQSGNQLYSHSAVRTWTIYTTWLSPMTIFHVYMTYVYILHVYILHDNHTWPSSSTTMDISAKDKKISPSCITITYVQLITKLNLINIFSICISSPHCQCVN